MHHPLNSAMMQVSNTFFDVNVEEDGALIDDSVSIDEVMAAHSARSGPSDPQRAGSMDLREEEPPIFFPCTVAKACPVRIPCNGRNTATTLRCTARSTYREQTYLQRPTNWTGHRVRMVTIRKMLTTTMMQAAAGRDQWKG
jgi:hypothetical protein